MTIRNQELPEFAPALRGYDRLQVDDYVGRLREYAMEVEERAFGAEAALTGAQEELADLRRHASLTSGGDLPPRLANILGLAKEEADDVRSRARADSEEMTRKARTALEEARRSARAEGERLVGEAVSCRKTVERQVKELEAVRDHLLGRLSDLGHELTNAVAQYRETRPSTDTTQRIDQAELEQRAG